MPRTFAYCRVSTQLQHNDNQVAEITASHLNVREDRFITETISGSVAAMERPGFKDLINKLEPLDVLVVTKMDRLGRSAMDVRATVEMLSNLGKPVVKAGKKEADPSTYGVKVYCLALGGVDLTSPAGKAVMTIIAVMAEFERDLIIERTTSGQARARAAGTHMGRPAKTTDAERELILTALAAGETVSSQATKYKISRASVVSIRTKAEAETA